MVKIKNEKDLQRLIKNYGKKIIMYSGLTLNAIRINLIKGNHYELNSSTLELTLCRKEK